MDSPTGNDPRRSQRRRSAPVDRFRPSSKAEVIVMVDGLLARPLHGDRYEWARTIVDAIESARIDGSPRAD